jgi:hypothetical protein
MKHVDQVRALFHFPAFLAGQGVLQQQAFAQ